MEVENIDNDNDNDNDNHNLVLDAVQDVQWTLRSANITDDQHMFPDLPYKNFDSLDTETTALILTFIYMITNREAIFRASSITILYDRMSAINTAAGLWRSKNVRQITTIAQGLYETIQQIFDIEFHHV